MNTKPITPYQRLLEAFRKYAAKCHYRDTHPMWSYPLEKLDKGWTLKDLWERVAAAETLGFDVQLIASKTGLDVEYIQKNPRWPAEL